MIVKFNKLFLFATVCACGWIVSLVLYYNNSIVKEADEIVNKKFHYVCLLNKEYVFLNCLPGMGTVHPMACEIAIEILEFDCNDYVVKRVSYTTEVRHFWVFVTIVNLGLALYTFITQYTKEEDEEEEEVYIKL